jgi:hypothetical protein
MEVIPEYTQSDPQAQSTVIEGQLGTWYPSQDTGLRQNLDIMLEQRRYAGTEMRRYRYQVDSIIDLAENGHNGGNGGHNSSNILHIIGSIRNALSSCNTQLTVKIADKPQKSLSQELK